MRGGFHGKHDLAFDVGKFPDLLHHKVIACTVVADGKGSVNSLTSDVNASLRGCAGNIDTNNKHGAHLEKKFADSPHAL